MTHKEGAAKISRAIFDIFCSVTYEEIEAAALESLKAQKPPIDPDQEMTPREIEQMEDALREATKTGFLMAIKSR